MFLVPAVYGDTSFFAATLNARDQHHEEARQIHYRVIEKKLS